MEAQDLQKWMAAPEKDEKMEDLYSARGIICESLAFMLGQKYSENGQLEKENSRLKEDLIAAETKLQNVLIKTQGKNVQQEKKIKELEEGLEAKTKKTEELQKEVDSLQEESTKKGYTIEFLENLVGGLQLEAITMEKALEEAAKDKKSTIEKLHEEFGVLTLELEKRFRSSTGVLETMVDMQKANDKLKGKLQRRDKTIANLQRDIALLEEEKEDRERLMDQLYTTASDEFDLSEEELNEAFSVLENEEGSEKIEREEDEDCLEEEENQFTVETEQKEEEELVDEIEWDLVKEAFNNCYTDLEAPSNDN